MESALPNWKMNTLLFFCCLEINGCQVVKGVWESYSINGECILSSSLFEPTVPEFSVLKQCEKFSQSLNRNGIRSTILFSFLLGNNDRKLKKETVLDETLELSFYYNHYSISFFVADSI